MNRRALDYGLLILVIFVFCFASASCKKKEAESPFKSELPDNAALTITSSDQVPELIVLEQGTQKSEVAAPTEAESTGSLPTPQQIQTALKNAGYYEGAIDGEIGSKSKKAILDFQKDNGLETDGKVGPKTWSKLKEHLSSQSSSQKAKE